MIPYGKKAYKRVRNKNTPKAVKSICLEDGWAGDLGNKRVSEKIKIKKEGF